MAMLKSPALDVPPEPPSKRRKTSPDPSSRTDTPEIGPNSSSASVTADLAEQLDNEERKKYIKTGKKLGEGQYADVYEAKLASDPSKLVAIKKIKIGSEAKDFGISLDSLREIRFLQELDHPNIIKLYTVFSTKQQNLNLVLEYLPQGDLLKLIQDQKNISYTPADIKSWMLMLSRAVYFCHANGILHRDIKPNNLLIAASGAIKLADFGLARSMADPFQRMTSNTITTWYRPPELFYGAQHYGGQVDVWSGGCVFAELIAREPLFFCLPESEMKMLTLISEKVGSPTEDVWPGVSSLKNYAPPAVVHPLRPREAWLAAFRAIGETGVDLLIKMLTLDPRQRLDAEGVLKHSFWTEDPTPSKFQDLPRKGGGLEEMGESLKQRGGELPKLANGEGAGGGGGRGDKVARKIDFGSVKK